MKKLSHLIPFLLVIAAISLLVLSSVKFDKYQDLDISDSTRELIEKYDISIRKTPYKSRAIIDRESDNFEVGSKYLKEHRFSQYYYDLAVYLNKRETILLGKSIRDKYWAEYDPLDKHAAVERFKTIIGYHELIPSGYSLGEIKSVKNRFGHNIDIIDFRGRFGVPFKLYRGVPEAGVKGIVIAIHGSVSGPDYVMGLPEKDNYSRSFGAYWVKKGFIVYAPQVDWSGGIPMERLNYTHQGAELAKLVDIVKYIKSRYPDQLPVISAGISHGSMLSEMLGVISPEIDAVISIGGNARAYPFITHFNKRAVVDPEKKYYHSYLPPDYYFYYSGIGLYVLLCPKPLVISIGTHDHGEEKFEMIFNSVEYYKSKGFGDKIKVNVFWGFHEADPEGEFLSFQKLKLDE